MNKTIFFLIDGLADKPRGDTPLKLAAKPRINKLLPYSFLAKFYPLTKQEWPESGYASVSQYANLGILNYSVKNLYLKRGPIEAIGSDIEFRNNWLATRVDFGTTDKNLKVIDRRAGRNTWGLNEIVNDLNKIKLDVEFALKHTYKHRGVLILKQKLSDKISNSDPLKTGKKALKIQPLATDKLSKQTAEIVQKFLEISNKQLNKHQINIKRIKKGLLPINYLLTREAGNKLPKLRKFSNKALVIAENGAIKGTCKLAGFHTLTVQEIELNGQMDFIFDAIQKKAAKYNLIYVHIKGADEAAHDKNCVQKKQIIEIFDKYLGNFIEKFGIDNFSYVITGDHITDCKTGKHEFGAVPILFIGKNNTTNNPKEFSEISAQKQISNIWNFIK